MTDSYIKELAGVEDLLLGAGTVTQTRSGVVVNIDKLNSGNIPYSGDAATSDFLSLKTAIDIPAWASALDTRFVAIDSGLVNALNLTVVPAPVSGDVFTLKQWWLIVPLNTNTAAVTATMGPITVNLKKIAGGAPIDLAAGDIQVLQPFLAWFDGTQLILLYPAATAAAGVMTGVMLDYGGATAPTGYLLCDGTAVSRTTYSDLFTVIGTLFGVGDGSTTFNVPDRRGRSSAGLDNMGGTSADTITDTAADIVGGVFGAETHTMTTAEIAEHGHTGSTNSTGSHTHTHNSYTNYISTGTGGTISGHAMYYAELGNATGSSGIHSHIVTISNTGSTTPFSIVDPKLFTNVIIKT